MDNKPRVGNIGGMSLRDYFAAQAPWPPHDWFMPAMAPRPTVVAYDFEDTIFQSTPKNWRELEAWDREQWKQRQLQWPYAWADAMLVTRGTSSR